MEIETQVIYLSLQLLDKTHDFGTPFIALSTEDCQFWVWHIHSRGESYEIGNGLQGSVEKLGWAVRITF